MKKVLFIFAAIVMMAGFTSKVMAQAGTTFTANASVASTVTLTNVADLDFGAIGSTATGGTVIMPTSGVRGAGTATVLTSNVGRAGSFTINGAIGNIVNLQMPTTPTILSAGVGKTMTINAADWVYKIGVAADNTNLIAMTANTVDVKVGATLQVNNNQAIGSYTGTYEIVIALQ